MYGAVLHSHASAGKFDEAETLFNGMISNVREKQEVEGGGAGPPRPGLTCYNSMQLVHLRSREFDKVLKLYHEMKELNIGTDASTGQAMILASYGIGGRDQTKECIQELLDSNVTMDQGSFELAYKILITTRGANTAPTTTDIRQALRNVMDTIPQLREVALNLNRSIRVAEVEEGRVPRQSLSIEILQQQRDAAWHDVMEFLMSYVQTKNESDNSSLSSSPIEEATTTVVVEEHGNKQ